MIDSSSKDNSNISQEKIAAIRGMNDILPKDIGLWEHFETVAQEVLRAYGYKQIRTPILEQTTLFARGIGVDTDVVGKEMYSFVDQLNGYQLSLRPEGTAAVVRACIQHNLLYNGPQRLWYMGPMFRHERPQKGRYRQFHQLGVEALGFAGPDIDAELILICRRLFDDLGLMKLTGPLAPRLELNCLGDPSERKVYRKALTAYFKQYETKFSLENQNRIYDNPLRILDSKDPELQELILQAPKLTDYLSDASKNYFAALQEILLENNLPFKINPYLVRGLNYYNLTAFEWVSDNMSAQNTIIGGGRYDYLIESLGGKANSACGFALGIERLLNLLQITQEKISITDNSCTIYLVHQNAAHAMVIAEQLRNANLEVIMHCSNRNTIEANLDNIDAQTYPGFKSQMKKANASCAAYAVIIGPDEIINNTAKLKSLRNSGEVTANTTGVDGWQKTVSIPELSNEIMDAILK